MKNMKHIKLFEQFIAEAKNTSPKVFVDSDGNPLVAGKKYFAPEFKEVLIPSFDGAIVILDVDGTDSSYEMTPYDFKANFKEANSRLRLSEEFITEAALTINKAISGKIKSYKEIRSGFELVIDTNGKDITLTFDGMSAPHVFLGSKRWSDVIMKDADFEMELVKAKKFGRNPNLYVINGASKNSIKVNGTKRRPKDSLGVKPVDVLINKNDIDKLA